MYLTYKRFGKLWEFCWRLLVPFGRTINKSAWITSKYSWKNGKNKGVCSSESTKSVGREGRLNGGSLLLDELPVFDRVWLRPFVTERVGGAEARSFDAHPKWIGSPTPLLVADQTTGNWRDLSKKCQLFLKHYVPKYSFLCNLCFSACFLWHAEVRRTQIGVKLS